MNFLKKIKIVLHSNLLIKELTVIPRKGASLDEIEEEENFTIRPLSPQHRELLQTWNGIDLDVIRFYGCGEMEHTLKSLRDQQIFLPGAIQKGIIIGSDPSGFLYIEDEKGSISYFDVDGGEILKIAFSLDDFICNYLFGTRAKEFGGEEWEMELKEHNII